MITIGSDQKLQLGQLLIKSGAITEEQLSEALRIQKSSSENLLLGEILQEQKFCSEEQILEILTEAATDPETLHVIWLVESGRGVTASVQGGFLEIVGQNVIREPHGETFVTSNVTFVTDSNYAANESGDFVLWDLDQGYALASQFLGSVGVGAEELRRAALRRDLGVPVW